MKTELIFSPHALRGNIDADGLLPKVAPEGSSFYLITDPIKTRKSYFVGAPGGGKGNKPRVHTSCIRSQAMKFSDLPLAESFATFVNNFSIFPEGAEFWVVLESAGYSAESSTRSQLTAVAGA